LGIGSPYYLVFLQGEASPPPLPILAVFYFEIRLVPFTTQFTGEGLK